MTALAEARTPRVGPREGPYRLALRRFLRHRAAVLSAAVLIVLTGACLAAPLVAQVTGHDPEAIDLLNRLQGPSAEHWLGTDDLGRDMFVRLLHGGQVSLTIGFTTALFAAAIGTVIGLLAGFHGGRVDGFLMRLTDTVIALPVLPLLIVLAAVDLGKLGLPEAMVRSDQADLVRIVVIVALFGWPTVARLVRGATLSLKARDFVRAARAMGASNLRLMLVHILPNLASPIIVATTLSIGAVILAESVLSFLALGIQPPTASWGNMLTGAQDLLNNAPHLAVFPGLAIFITVIAFNFLGDGLQDALDPRAETRR